MTEETILITRLVVTKLLKFQELKYVFSKTKAKLSFHTICDKDLLNIVLKIKYNMGEIRNVSFNIPVEHVQ